MSDLKQGAREHLSTWKLLGTFSGTSGSTASMDGHI